MSDIIADPSAPTNPTALGEFVGCFGSGCQRGEWTAKAAERGWSQPATNEWLCPQCAANAADRADFIARKTTARAQIADRLWLSMQGMDSVEAQARIEAELDAYRAEVLAEAIVTAQCELTTDGTGHPEDLAYDQGVSDVIAAIAALFEAGKSRG